MYIYITFNMMFSFKLLISWFIAHIMVIHFFDFILAAVFRAREPQDVKNAKTNNRFTLHTVPFPFCFLFLPKNTNLAMVTVCLHARSTVKRMCKLRAYNSSNANRHGSSSSYFSVLKYTSCLIKKMLLIFSKQYVCRSIFRACGVLLFDLETR